MINNGNASISLYKATNLSFYQIAEIRNRQLALKLMEMGCLKGMIIQKLSSAPIKGPIMIKVFPNENLLALRSEEALDILLTLTEN